MPPDAPETEFVKLIRSLIAGGFLELAEFSVGTGEVEAPR